MGGPYPVGRIQKLRFILLRTEAVPVDFADLLDLYKYLDAYIDRHRGILLGGAKDPQTLFVKTVKTTSIDAAYNSTTFYEAWRTVIQRYGIYNPYTGRGAIKGLLPHGPHNLRDILATHILKQTGSYEQASYAIQDTPDVVQQHYGRFLPQDKAALAPRSQSGLGSCVRSNEMLGSDTQNMLHLGRASSSPP